MARTKSLCIRPHLKDLVSDQQLLKAARQTGFAKRRQMIDPADFFWTPTLELATGRQRQTAGVSPSFLSMRARRAEIGRRFDTSDDLNKIPTFQPALRSEPPRAA